MRLVLILKDILRVYEGRTMLAEYEYGSPNDISPEIIEQLRTQAYDSKA